MGHRSVAGRTDMYAETEDDDGNTLAEIADVLWPVHVPDG